MTREQLKEFVKRMTETSGLSEEQLAEKINDAFDNKSKPSLPSNLDEAANEKVDELIADMKINGDMIYLPTARVLMIALARFEAEWMKEYSQDILRRFNEIRKK